MFRKVQLKRDDRNEASSLTNVLLNLDPEPQHS